MVSTTAEGCQINSVDPGTKSSSNGFKAVGAQGDCNQRCKAETSFQCEAFITTGLTSEWPSFLNSGLGGPCLLLGTLDRNISLMAHSKYYLQDLKCASRGFPFPAPRSVNHRVV